MQEAGYSCNVYEAPTRRRLSWEREQERLGQWLGRLPRPVGAFEARVFGPYLVVRTRRPTVTPKRYLQLAAAVMVAGKTLGIVDADINFTTITRAATNLERGYEATSSLRSASTISR